MAWPLTDDGQFYRFEGEVLMPVDPTSGAAILMLRPKGGMGVGIPAIERGDDGLPANIDTQINWTPMEPDDPNPDFAYWTQITPPTSTTAGVYRLNLGLHTGKDGKDGTTTLTLAGVGGSSAPKKTVVVNNAGTGFVFQTQKVGDRYIPSTIANTASGLGVNTLCVFTVVSNQIDFDWRPEVIGHTVITQSGGPDVRVDLLARLNNETGGNIIAHCPGIAPNERLQLTPCQAAGLPSPDAYDKVSANAAATIYVRVEQVGGANSFTTSGSTSRFAMRVRPIP